MGASTSSPTHPNRTVDFNTKADEADRAGGPVSAAADGAGQKASRAGVDGNESGSLKQSSKGARRASGMGCDGAACDVCQRDGVLARAGHAKAARRAADASLAGLAAVIAERHRQLHDDPAAGGDAGARLRGVPRPQPLQAPSAEIDSAVDRCIDDLLALVTAIEPLRSRPCMAMSSMSPPLYSTPSSAATSPDHVRAAARGDVTSGLLLPPALRVAPGREAETLAAEAGSGAANSLRRSFPSPPDAELQAGGAGRPTSCPPMSLESSGVLEFRRRRSSFGTPLRGSPRVSPTVPNLAAPPASVTAQLEKVQLQQQLQHTTKSPTPPSIGDDAGTPEEGVGLLPEERLGGSGRQRASSQPPGGGGAGASAGKATSDDTPASSPRSLVGSPRQRLASTSSKSDGNLLRQARAEGWGGHDGARVATPHIAGIQRVSSFGRPANLQPTPSLPVGSLFAQPMTSPEADTANPFGLLCASLSDSGNRGGGSPTTLSPVRTSSFGRKPTFGGDSPPPPAADKPLIDMRSPSYGQLTKSQRMGEPLGCAGASNNFPSRRGGLRAVEKETSGGEQPLIDIDHDAAAEGEEEEESSDSDSIGLRQSRQHAWDANYPPRQGDGRPPHPHPGRLQDIRAATSPDLPVYISAVGGLDITQSASPPGSVAGSPPQSAQKPGLSSPLMVVSSTFGSMPEGFDRIPSELNVLPPTPLDEEPAKFPTSAMAVVPVRTLPHRASSPTLLGAQPSLQHSRSCPNVEQLSGVGQLPEERGMPDGVALCRSPRFAVPEPSPGSAGGDSTRKGSGGSKTMPPLHPAALARQAQLTPRKRSSFGSLTALTRSPPPDVVAPGGVGGGGLASSFGSPRFADGGAAAADHRSSSPSIPHPSHRFAKSRTTPSLTQQLQQHGQHADAYRSLRLAGGSSSPRLLGGGGGDGDVDETPTPTRSPLSSSIARQTSNFASFKKSSTGLISPVTSPTLMFQKRESSFSAPRSNRVITADDGGDSCGDLLAGLPAPLSLPSPSSTPSLLPPSNGSWGAGGSPVTTPLLCHKQPSFGPTSSFGKIAAMSAAPTAVSPPPASSWAMTTSARTDGDEDPAAPQPSGENELKTSGAAGAGGGDARDTSLPRDVEKTP